MKVTRRPRLPRAVKKQLPKEIPAGSPSNTLILGTKPKPNPVARTPRPPKGAPESPVKVPREKILAVIARRYARQDPTGCERAKDPRIDPKDLAEEVATGPFSPVLAKYGGLAPQPLMESVIDHIRNAAEHPEVTEQVTTDEDTAERAKKALTTRQQQQARSATSPPAMDTATSSRTKRGAAKTVPRREVYTDLQIVQDELHELFQKHPELRAMFCRASTQEARQQLLLSNKRIRRLNNHLRSGLASPTRVNNYLEAATKLLIDTYIEEQAIADERAEQEAAGLRAEKIAAARVAAETRELQEKKLRYQRENNGPAFWRGLNKT